MHRSFPDYSRWENTDLQGLKNKTIAQMHTINNLSSPIVPESGLYHVYGQITLRGKFTPIE